MPFTKHKTELVEPLEELIQISQRKDILKN